jgi:two-component system nitrate/nitrite response regulator NarL
MQTFASIVATRLSCCNCLHRRFFPDRIEIVRPEPLPKVSEFVDAGGEHPMLDALKVGDSTVRVLVADGSHIHTQLLVEALRRDRGFLAVPFEFDSVSLPTVLQNLNIDVLLMSSLLDEQPGRGFQVLRELRSSIPKIRAVILLDSSADEAILNAFRAGARGVVSKTEPLHTLNECVRCVHDGYIWANRRELTLAIEALAAAPAVRAVNAKGMNLLSKRELQIVRSLAEGLTNREIAERLKLSQHTVKNYLFRVFDKMGVSSRMELLFMTLAESEAQPAGEKSKAPASGIPLDEFGVFLQAAANGLPLPPVALAQMYGSLQKQPPDLIQAYAWYLLAANQSSQTRDQISQSMTIQQIEEAQRQSQVWLTRLQTSGPRPASPQLPKPLARADAPHSPDTKQSAKTKAAYL